MLLSCAASGSGVATTQEASDQEPRQVLVQNVRVWDGTSEELSEITHVLVEGNLIKSISRSAEAAEGATVINGGGRVLIPGLLDAHVHLALVRRPDEIRNDYDWMYVGAMAGDQARRMLLRGFTTVRDIGGPTHRFGARDR
jgi:imidazolonepropionase-like amidohydrolase